MTYQPNFKDPRVIKRVEDVLLFAWSKKHSDDMEYWSQSYLDRVFGKSSNQFSNYLREILLICTNENYSADAHIPKQYIINADGIKFLIQSLSGTTSLNWTEWCADLQSTNPTSSLLRSAAHADAGRIPEEKIKEERCEIVRPTHSPFMYPTSTKSAGSMSDIEKEKMIDLFSEKFEYQLDTGEFEYEEKKNRDFNHFQSIPKQVRNPIASRNGYKYDYDIDCAQPTIISQFAKMKGMQQQTPAIDYYIHNKTIVRTRLSRLLFVDTKTVKLALNAMFNNCPIVKPYHPEILPAIYKALGCNEGRIQLMSQDPFIKQLRSEIKQCWKYLADTNNLVRREYVDADGVICRERRNGKDYAATYRQQETIISRCVRNYLHSKSFKIISIHDGWNCQQELDTQALITHVYNVTGYKLNLTLTLL